MLSQTDIYELVNKINEKKNLSGAVLVKERNNVMYEAAYGYANRSDAIVNDIETRFSMATGSKLFTAIGICQLVERGFFTLETRVKDCLNIYFPHFDEGVTIHQLLTHTSGISDYFNKHLMEDFEEIWSERPMYRITRLKNYLPMFQIGHMLFKPGEKFDYNNAGYILLGLIIEELSGLSYTDYIEEMIFKPCGMSKSGYYSLDNLPENTALGYIENNEQKGWKTNIYSIPVRGSADSGAFTTAADMMKLWEGLLSYHLLSKKYTHIILNPHIKKKKGDYYGYGLWIKKKDNVIYKYHINGEAPGVNFCSSVYPLLDLKLVVTGNQNGGPSDVTKAIEKSMAKMWLLKIRGEGF